jgi:hypothetical protein
MKIDADNYNQMKAWFDRLVPETVPADLLTPEAHPIACLEQIEARWPAKARTGLAMAIGDTIEQTDGWPLEKVAAVDELLASDDLPTLTEMRVRFSKVIQRVLSRGSIKNGVEYYAARNAAELANDSHADLWKLLAAYEERAAG